MPATEIFDDLDDSVEELDSWLAIYRRLVRTAPPSLLEIAQTAFNAMNDVYTKRAGEQDQVGAELVDAERGRATARDDFVAQKHGLRGSHGGDDGSGDARALALPLSPRDSRCMSLGTTTDHPERIMFDEQFIQWYPPLFSSRRIDQQRTRPNKVLPCPVTTPRPFSATRPLAALITSPLQSPQAAPATVHALPLNLGPSHLRFCTADRLRTLMSSMGGVGIASHRPPPPDGELEGKKRSLEVEEVEEDNVDEDHGGDERDREGPRPKRSRFSADCPSVCHPFNHVHMEVNRENDGRVHATNLASIPLAAPAPAVAPVLSLAPAAWVVGPVPMLIAPVAQPVQPALVLVSPLPAAQAQPIPAHLSPVA